MNIKKLEKATKIYEQIKVLDAQIIEIDKFAMLVANSETKSSFELKCKDLGKKKDNEEKVGFDADGSLIKGQTEGYRSMFDLWMPRLYTTTADKKNENEIVLKNELSVNAVMSILGILLC
jgi:hypothetical protein